MMRAMQMNLPVEGEMTILESEAMGELSSPKLTHEPMLPSNTVAKRGHGHMHVD